MHGAEQVRPVAFDYSAMDKRRRLHRRTIGRWLEESTAVSTPSATARRS